MIEQENLINALIESTELLKTGSNETRIGLEENNPYIIILNDYQFSLLGFEENEVVLFNDCYCKFTTKFE